MSDDKSVKYLSGEGSGTNGKTGSSKASQYVTQKAEIPWADGGATGAPKPPRVQLKSNESKLARVRNLRFTKSNRS